MYKQNSYVASASRETIDVGLRSYMLKVYNWMSSGLVLTGIIAYLVANTSLRSIFYEVSFSASGVSTPHLTALGWVAMLAPLAFILVLSFGIDRLSVATAQAIFWAFSAVMGASLSSIFLQYTGSSIAEVFFITAGTFAAMSIWGYTTGKDLTAMGSFMMMGLFGIIIASVVNIFVGSSAMQFGISILGVLIFVGLTAFDTQRIKNDYIGMAGQASVEMLAKRSIMDALELYLDFLNLFMYILRLVGVTSNND
jgi:hypothetical protein